MVQVVRLTIREASESICRQFGGKQVPDWKLRRVVDAMESAGLLDVQRVGSYRTVADTDLALIAGQLEKIGWLRREVATCS